MNFLLECFEMLEEARRDPNLKGMGNLNMLDNGLKRLLLTKVDKYYKFNYNDPKRSTLQAGFGTGSQLKALPGVSATTTPYKMLDAFKNTSEIKALIIQVGEDQVGLVSKFKDHKTGIVTFGLGISEKVHKMATKEIKTEDVVKHALNSKKESIDYIHKNKHYSNEEREAKLKELETEKSHNDRVQSARNHFEADALEKLTKIAFKSGRNSISGWDLARGMVSGQSKTRAAEWIEHLIAFVRGELGDKEAPVKYIGITADPEREKIHAERETAKAGMVPRDEESLFIKKALAKGRLDAIEHPNVPPAYSAYITSIKKSLKQRADELRVAKANDAAVTIDSATNLHKLLLSGKFHDKFKLVVNSKPYVYNFYDERNLRYSKLIDMQKGKKVWESDMPYIEFHLEDKGEESSWMFKKEFRDKIREIEADVEANKLTKDEGVSRIETIEREMLATAPPTRIYLYLTLSGFGLAVSEIGLMPTGSYSSGRADLIMYKVKYNEHGAVEGLTLMPKSAYQN